MLKRIHSVRQRIVIVMAVVLLMVISAQVFSRWVANQHRQRVESLRAEYAQAVGSFFQVLQRLDETSHLLGEVLARQADANPDEMAELRGEVVAALEELNSRITLPSVRSILVSAEEEYGRVSEASDRLLAEVAAQEAGAGSAEAEYAALLDVWVVGGEFMERLLAIAQSGTAALGADMATVRDDLFHLGVTEKLVHLVVILLSGILAIRLALSITRPMHELQKGATEFSQGNLTTVIGVDSKDEFGQLAKCFEEMGGKISEMLSEGKRVADLSLMVSSSLDVDEIAQRLLGVIRQFTGGRMVTLTMESLDGDGWIRYRWEEPDNFTRERTDSFHHDASSEVIPAQQFVSIPLIAQRKVVGSLEIRDFSQDLDIEKQINLLSSMLVSVSMALRNAQVFDQLKVEKERAAKQAEDLALANAEIERTQRFKSLFLAGMSHRLRTPLNSVIGCADLMITGVMGDISDKQRQALDTVKRCGHSLLSSIDHILNYSRLEAGDVEMLWGDFEVREVIDSGIGRVDSALCRGEISHRIEISPEATRWSSDSVKVRHIVQYLVEHAVSAAQATEVNIAVALQGEKELAVSVTDNGRGYDAEEVQQVFEPFEMSERREGSGLGLAIARRLTELIGGDLSVKSEIESGSTFTFTVPHHVEP